VPDGTELGSGARGVGIMAEAGRYGGENWLFKLGYSRASPKLPIKQPRLFRPAQFPHLPPSLGLRTTPPAGRFPNQPVELFFEHRRDWELRDNLNTDLHIDATLQLANLWTIYASSGPYPTWVENRETQDGARTERAGGAYGRINIKSDPNRPVVLEILGTVDARLRGHEWHGSATLSLRPFAALDLDI